MVKARNELVERTMEIRRVRITSSAVAYTVGTADDQPVSLVASKNTDVPRLAFGMTEKGEFSGQGLDKVRVTKYGRGILT